MNGRKTRSTGSHPRSSVKRNGRSQAVKKTAQKIGSRAAITDRARQKVRRRKR